MIELNLTATNRQEELVKDYLKNNVSETLAEKINNGVKIVKDSKTLFNKKTLSGFMKYACVEARKQAEKGANSACVEDATVFGWAVHYFEEDSIEEKLLNEDGSDYKPVIKTTPQPKVEVKPVIKKENEQTNLFEFLNNKTEEQDDNIEEDEDVEEKQPKQIEKDNLLIDTSTGEVFENTNQTFDKYILETISNLFDNKLKLE